MHLLLTQRLTVHPPAYPSIRLPISMHSPIRPPFTNPSSIYPPPYPFTHLPVHPSSTLPLTHPPIHPSTHLSSLPSIHLSTHPFIHHPFTLPFCAVQSPWWVLSMCGQYRASALWSVLGLRQERSQYNTVPVLLKLGTQSRDKDKAHTPRFLRVLCIWWGGAGRLGEPLGKIWRGLQRYVVGSVIFDIRNSLGLKCSVCRLRDRERPE